MKVRITIQIYASYLLRQQSHQKLVLLIINLLSQNIFQGMVIFLISRKSSRYSSLALFT